MEALQESERVEVTMEHNKDIFSNDRKSQKRFVDWAYDRIAQEMERIEELEEEFGTAEYVVPSRTNKSPKNLSDDKKIEAVLKIDKLREEGYSFKLASELCDIAPSTYTKWKRQFKTRLGKPSE